MFKKISAAVLVMAIMLVMVLPMSVSAALYTADVDVVSNLMVKNASGGSYVNAPVGTPLTATTGSSFGYIATADMSAVRAKFTELLAIAESKYPSSSDKFQVTMKMVLTAMLPNGMTIGSDFASGSNMDGFSGYAGKGKPSDLAIYKEIKRGQDGKELTIEVGLQNPDDTTLDYVTGKQLNDNLDTYLGDLQFEYSAIKASSTGKLTVSATLEGYTEITYLGTEVGKINYKGVQDATTGDDDLTATVLINSSSSSSGSGSGGRTGGGNAGTTITAPQIITNVNGKPINAGYAESVDGQYVVDVDELPEPDDVPGYASSNRWYRDPGCTIPAEGRIPVDGETTFYTRYVNITAPSKFISDKHLAYIIGYPDGYIQPEKNISREEVAVILYRLLNKDVKASIYAETNNFSDVEDTRWSNTAISTMSNGGFVQGYPNGTYQPQKFITRAEFATLLVRFLDEGQIAAGDFGFVDISGHWAEADIKKAADYMWILGYTDGTFKPDQYITRAEAITIFNRVLVRYADAEGVLSSAKQWDDVTSDKWYYYQIIEATNSHDFTRRADRYNETWTGLLEENLIY